MKKYISLILSVVLFITLFCGCSAQNDNKSYYSDEIIVEHVIVDQTSSITSTVTSSEDTSKPQTQTQTNSDEQTSSQEKPSECVHEYQEQIKVKAQLFTMGEKKYTCVNCGDNYMKKYCVEELKILSISNSYGKNALWELYVICKAEGVKKVDIAVMYIKGCSLD